LDKKNKINEHYHHILSLRKIDDPIVLLLMFDEKWQEHILDRLVHEKTDGRTDLAQYTCLLTNDKPIL